MIVSASYKTDIPAFYGAWFMARLAAGSCQVTNPYGGRPFTVGLDHQSAAGFVFWTRNVAPFRGCLDQLRDDNRPFVVQFTLTGYPRLLDSATIDAERAVADIRDITDKFGKRVCVWRYDPIVATDVTPFEWHRRNFATLAGQLKGAVDEVVVSFAQIYQKTRRNLDAMRADDDIGWYDPVAEEKMALLAELREIAANNSMQLTLCGQPELIVDEVAEARCIDGTRLANIAGHELDMSDKPHRAQCACHTSRDIGAYDSCPHGCVYCYAVRNREFAKTRHAAHDPQGEFLIPVPHKAPAE